MSKPLVGGSKGCKNKTSSWYMNGFPPMEITLGQQYNNVGKKPPVILYAYTNRHAGTLENIVKTKQCSTPSHMVAIIYYNMGDTYCTKPLHSL